MALPHVAARAGDLVDFRLAGLGEALEQLHRGRLLVWNRDETIDDGAGEAETSGYLDESDMPPWDTWVAYADANDHPGILLAWVPDDFVPPVSAAIRVNAYDALYWLSDSKLPLASLLRDDNLLV